MASHSPEPIPQHYSRLHLVWVFRSRDLVSAFTPQLFRILDSANIHLQIHLYETAPDAIAANTEISPLLGNRAPEETAALASLPIATGRPDLAKVLREVVEGAKDDSSVRGETSLAIWTCGNESLKQDVEAAALVVGEREEVSLYFHFEDCAL